MYLLRAKEQSADRARHEPDPLLMAINITT